MTKGSRQEGGERKMRSFLREVHTLVQDFSIRTVSTLLLDKVQIVSCSKNNKKIDPLAESAKTFIISQTE